MYSMTINVIHTIYALTAEFMAMTLISADNNLSGPDQAIVNPMTYMS